jgi:short-subunit dehydrogenase
MKRAIVIGATSGIGRQLVKILAARNYIVGATGRRENLLAGLQQEFPEKIFTACFDVTDTPIVLEKLENLVGQIGGLDLLIFSAGTGHPNPTLDFALEKDAIVTNVFAFTQVADWAFAFFEKQKSGQLVGISSIAGLRGNRHAPAYNATKAFQINYLEGLRQKAQKTNLPITITDIRPGFVDTAMAKGEGIFWMASVDKAATQICRAIENKKAIAYITRRWAFVALIMRLMPRALYQRL